VAPPPFAEAVLGFKWRRNLKGLEQRIEG